MPTCYTLIGPMGCGKSTWRAMMLPSLSSPVVVSTDDIVEEIALQKGIAYHEVWKQHGYLEFTKSARARLIRGVLAGSDLIIDQTNCTFESRQLFRQNIPAHYHRVGVVFEFDAKEIRQRVWDRGKATGKIIPIVAVNAKIKEFEYPSENEFDEIIVVPRG